MGKLCLCILVCVIMVWLFVGVFYLLVCGVVLVISLVCCVMLVLIMMRVVKVKVN